jgi:RNAse (barnase) inhibitor barstar
MKEGKVKKENAFWDQLMDKIKKPVNYAEKSLEYIDKEKVQLVQLVKNLNQRLNKKL